MDMKKLKKNDYGSLCTEMYEILHQKAPQDELAFYLSYAEKGLSILEPLCGSGRFLISFLERGFSIQGMDNSKDMVNKLLEKAPNAKVVLSDIENFQTKERFDYIFICSGSVSLFTDMQVCKMILSKMKSLLKENGKFVFAVDTIAARQPASAEYRTEIAVRTKENYQLLLRSKSSYDEATHTQFSPSLYELYDDDRLLQREEMNFQTHLYALGEMDAILKEIGFSHIAVYASFNKDKTDNESEMLLYECSL